MDMECEKSECGGGGPLLVQGREAIVWSGEHFYLVAFGERGVMVDMSPRKSKHGRPTITYVVYDINSSWKINHQHRQINQ